MRPLEPGERYVPRTEREIIPTEPIRFRVVEDPRGGKEPPWVARLEAKLDLILERLAGRGG
jgi:hypothetical protein